MVTHIGDVAIALAMDRRHVRAASLQAAVADQAHVHRLRRIADFGLLGVGRRDEHDRAEGSRGDKNRASVLRRHHVAPFFFVIPQTVPESERKFRTFPTSLQAGRETGTSIGWL